MEERQMRWENVRKKQSGKKILRLKQQLHRKEHGLAKS
jgi:hypothetical protein